MTGQPGAQLRGGQRPVGQIHEQQSVVTQEVIAKGGEIDAHDGRERIAGRQAEDVRGVHLGEIVVPAVRRRRLARQVAMHVVTATLIGIVLLTSGIVYLSLERPHLLDEIKADPGLAARKMIGSGS